MLSLVAGATALPATVRAAPMPPPGRRRLCLTNPHTGETFDGTYRDDRGPLPAALADLSVFLRDFHSSATAPIDVGVLDFLAAVMDAVNAQTATILSAYRTPKTNAMLAHTTFGVADNSQHLYGRALDVHFGERLPDAMRAARVMQRGGVGWYSHSGFMHIDTGPGRNWDLDEVGLGVMLSQGRRVGSDERANGEVQVNDKRFSPTLQHSGGLMPALQSSGGVSPELQRSGRIVQ